MRKIRLFLLFAMAALLLLTGCGAGRKIQAENVLNTEKFKNMDVSDWQNNTTFIYSKGNSNLKKVNGNYPLSLYLHDLNTKKDTILRAEENTNFESAVFSPDKKYLVYIRYNASQPENSVTEMNLCLMDMETRIEIVLFPNVRDFAWTGRNWIVFNSPDTTYLTDVYSQTANVTAETGKYFNDGLWFLPDMVFYIDRPETSPAGGSLFQLKLSSQQKILFAEYAETFIPSPDQKNALVMLNPESGKVSLVMMSLDGEHKLTITEQEKGTMIRSWWSPDQRCVVYTVIFSEGSPDNALYLYDASSGNTIKVASGVHDPTVSWNPASDKFASSDFNGKSFDSTLYALGTPA